MEQCLVLHLFLGTCKQEKYISMNIVLVHNNNITKASMNENDFKFENNKRSTNSSFCPIYKINHRFQHI